MGYRLWDPQNSKIIHNNDVIFDETCMYKEPIEPQGPTRVIINDDEHLGQLPRVRNKPEQQKNQPIDDAQNG